MRLRHLPEHESVRVRSESSLVHSVPGQNNSRFELLFCRPRRLRLGILSGHHVGDVFRRGESAQMGCGINAAVNADDRPPAVPAHDPQSEDGDGHEEADKPDIVHPRTLVQRFAGLQPSIRSASRSIVPASTLRVLSMR